MRSNPHTFGWEEEPSDERPSEFMSTGYSILSGYHVPRDLSARHARRRRGNGFGFKSVAVVAVVLLGLSGVAIHEFGKLFRL